MYKPGRVYFGNHVRHGFDSFLLGYFPLVYHLEHGFQYCEVIYSWTFDMDTLARYLHPTAEEDLREIIGYPRYGSQVQT